MPDTAPVTREEFTSLFESHALLIQSTNQDIASLSAKSDEIVNAHNGLHDKHDLLVAEFNENSFKANNAKWLRFGFLTGIINSSVLVILLSVSVGFIIYQQSTISDLKTRVAKQELSQQQFANETGQQFNALDEDAATLDKNITVLGHKLNEVRAKVNLPLIDIGPADTYQKK